MKIKLTQPLPQIGRVIPAGVLIEDAPFSLKDRLVKQGKAVWAFDDDQGDGENSVPVSPVMAEEKQETEVTDKQSSDHVEAPVEVDKPARKRKKGGRKPNG